MSKNLKLFAGFSTAWSIAFFATLNWSLYAPEKRWPVILLATILYGTGSAFAGMKLGQADDQSNVRYSLSFWYLFTSIMASLVVGAIWVFFWQPGDADTLLFMSTGYALGFIFVFLNRKRNIKGIRKDRVFR